MVINLFLLSLHLPVPKTDKFIKYLIFREALCISLFTHTIGPEGTGEADTSPVAGPTNAVILPGDSIPRADPDAEGEAAKIATRTAYKAGKILMTATTAPKVEHQRISMKRGPCVVCKQAAAEKRRGVSVGGKKGRALHEYSPNITNKSKDRHVARAMTGCSACKVLLCSTKGCWEAYHSAV